jgi:hypothetical protein
MNDQLLAPCDASRRPEENAMELPRRRFLQLAASGAALPAVASIAEPFYATSAGE